MVAHWLEIVAVFGCLCMVSTVLGQDSVPEVVLAIHGGTGIDKKDMTPPLEEQLRAVLEAALKAGYDRLQQPQATSLDAVETAIRVMEDSPLFNAGRGAVFTHEGRNELDASIMEGKEKRAGAVAGVTRIKNPITAARAVMERSKHVMFVGEGAEAFAREQGLEMVNPMYFWTPHRWEQIQKILRSEGVIPTDPTHEHGTVGAVALDRNGNLAAGTSTGGMTNKQFGRVGDSPIIGAGTYADNAACAVSCTGHGEFFIRFAVSHEVVSLMKYQKRTVAEAVEAVINGQLKPAGGEGGCVALDAKGNYAAARSTEGLYRGYVTKEGKIRVMLYED